MTNQPPDDLLLLGVVAQMLVRDTAQSAQATIQTAQAARMRAAEQRRVVQARRLAYRTTRSRAVQLRERARADRTAR
jgi:hypothetical protein